ncbi:hypothetical protein O1611_g3598 [Lasiodiplodia mahajangana]|uniref:Uncharacterized protein n=1 Tax=Lasiodiplodia mahajangana TaxID=1108764 RepID=A0ACC2JRC4_9PEZI|nr:hypothetical protein O1611_g3598 [Lasiodiplodia mahajangana]
MVRRRRRPGANALAAAEIAATEKRLAVRHYKESSVLKPVNPSVHSDNWPCFLLTDATVHVPDGAMVSQLEVDLMGPLIVRGKLELEKDNERYLVNRHMKGRALRIQIEASRAFSVGAKDDSLSVPVVWASGEAGWFEIVPAPCYQRICDEMFQAVSLHYSLLDQFEEALEKLQKSKKKKKATMADVTLDLDELLFQVCSAIVPLLKMLGIKNFRSNGAFLQYALRSGDGLTLPEAHRRFNQNCIFLLSHFPKDTSVYKHLADKYSSTVKLLANKDRKPRDPSFDICRLPAYDYSQREKSSSLESARAKKGSPAGGSPKDDDVIMTDPPKNDVARLRTSRSHKELNENNSTLDLNVVGVTKSSGNVLFDALQDVRGQMLQQISEGKQKKRLDQITAKSWQTKVYMECNIKHYNSVEEIFHYHARDLVQRLGPEWHDTMIYEWAKERAAKPPTLTLISEEEVNQIVRRVKKSARGNHTEKPAKEILRPEVREYAGKQTPTSRPSGKAAGLRPSTGGKKRLRYDIDLEDSMDIDEDGSLKKKSKKSHLTEDEDEDEDEDEEQDDESIDEDGAGSSRRSKSYAENNDAPTTQLVIRAEKLPSTQPKGPNQTWICEEPDCGYIVRAAHEEQGRKLISTHYEEHEKEAQDVAQETALNRVNLAVQEARGHMPINHLLEKNS